MDQQQENVLNQAVKDALHLYSDERFTMAKELALQVVDKCGSDLTLDLLRALSPPVPRHQATASDRATIARAGKRRLKIERNVRILEIMYREPAIDLYSHDARTIIKKRLRKAGDLVTKPREIDSFLQLWRAMSPVSWAKLGVLDETPDWIGKSSRPEIRKQLISEIHKRLPTLTERLIASALEQSAFDDD
jgi:hypothetical protein